jgi:hypothetical protein
VVAADKGCGFVLIHHAKLMQTPQAAHAMRGQVVGVPLTEQQPADVAAANYLAIVVAMFTAAERSGCRLDCRTGTCHKKVP